VVVEVHVRAKFGKCHQVKCSRSRVIALTEKEAFSYFCMVGDDECLIYCSFTATFVGLISTEWTENFREILVSLTLLSRAHNHG